VLDHSAIVLGIGNTIRWTLCSVWIARWSKMIVLFRISIDEIMKRIISIKSQMWFLLSFLKHQSGYRSYLFDCFNLNCVMVFRWLLIITPETFIISKNEYCTLSLCNGWSFHKFIICHFSMLGLHAMSYLFWLQVLSVWITDYSIWNWLLVYCDSIRQRSVCFL